MLRSKRIVAFTKSLPPNRRVEESTRISDCAELQTFAFPSNIISEVSLNGIDSIYIIVHIEIGRD